LDCTCTCTCTAAIIPNVLDGHVLPINVDEEDNTPTAATLPLGRHRWVRTDGEGKFVSVGCDGVTIVSAVACRSGPNHREEILPADQFERRCCCRVSLGLLGCCSSGRGLLLLLRLRFVVVAATVVGGTPIAGGGFIIVTIVTTASSIRLGGSSRRRRRITGICRREKAQLVPVRPH
jgi:hypothetical protein